MLVVLLGGHPDQVRRYGLKVSSVGGGYPVVARAKADDLLDENALPVAEELPKPVQGDDRGEHPGCFKLIQPRQEPAEQLFVKRPRRDSHTPMLQAQSS